MFLLFIRPLPYIVHPHPRPDTMAFTCSLPLASLANALPASPLRNTTSSEKRIRAVKDESVSFLAAVFLLKDGALEAIQRFAVFGIKGPDVAREVLTYGGDAKSGEDAVPILAESGDLDQLNSRRTARRAWLDQAFVDGGSVCCPKDKGDDGEDSGEVHLVFMRCQNLILLFVVVAVFLWCCRCSRLEDGESPVGWMPRNL